MLSVKFFQTVYAHQALLLARLPSTIVLRGSINLVQAIKALANAVKATTAIIPCANFSGLSKELTSIIVINLPSNIDKVIITGNAFNGSIPSSLLNT